MGKRRNIDWDKIETQYRAGQKSIRTLADEFSIAPSSISRRIKQYQWFQDKSDEIRQRTAAAIVAQRERNTPTPKDIEIAVKTNVQVIKEHRKSISANQALVTMLSQQLRDAAENRDEMLEAIDEECVKPDGEIDYAKRARLQKALLLSTHSSVLRDLSTAQKNLVALERQAFSLDKDTTATGPIKTELSDADREILNDLGAEYIKRKLSGGSGDV